MERRETLKTISLVLGYSLTPAVLSGLLTSCSQDATVNWQPKFFSKPEAFALENLANVLLPKTSTPSATEVNAHIFADLFLSDIANNEDQTTCKKGVEILINRFNSDTGISLGDAGTKEFTSILNKYFNIDADEQTTIKEMLETEPLDLVGEDYYLYSFLFKVKDLIMVGYYASEEIGENVLSYLPVPGKFEGCIPVESVGKAWSL